jgi:cupin fold WbuC family metalloprotein
MTTRIVPQDWIEATDLAVLIEEAAASPRLRAYRDLHSASGPLRTVIALEPGAYVRPHSHCTAEAGALERLIVLRGAIGVVLFDATSTARMVRRAGAADRPRSIRFPAGIVHTAVALSPGTIMLELRDSGGRGSSEKHFAEHFPDEEDPGSRTLVAQWTDLCLRLGAGITRP